jgi:hypothetical protein
MKLYTEDEVRRIIKIAFWQDFENGTTEEDIIGFANCIELPSDEEINTENEKIYGKDSIVDMGTNLKWAYLEAFEVGANWVINHIKQQKDGTI